MRRLGLLLLAAIGLAILWKRRDVLTIMRELEGQ